MIRTFAALLAILAVPYATAAEARATYQFNLPEQSLSSALKAIGQQTTTNILFDPGSVLNKTAPALRATLTAKQAIEHVLQGTDLTAKESATDTVLVQPQKVASVPLSTLGERGRGEAFPPLPLGEGPGEGINTQGEGKGKGFWSRFRLAQADTASKSDTSNAEGADKKTSENSPESSQKRIELEEIVVTGSHIRGAQIASPLLTITQEEMRLSGHNNLGEVIRALPQNFGGGQNPGVAAGAAIGVGQASNRDITGGSSLNLRGLGTDATLTLLNGARLPYDGLHQATDVAFIPTAVVERIEILLDGASAIYGSDAVGGVANVILKRDYEGVELSARAGAATDGGYEQTQYTALAGTNWGSGGVLVTGDYSKHTGVLARQRDYLGHMLNQNVNIYPPVTQGSTLVSGHQQLGDRVEFGLDGFYTERVKDMSDRQTAASFTFTEGNDSVIWGFAPSLRFALPGQWLLRLHGATGRDEAKLRQVLFLAQTREDRFGYFNKAESAGIEAEGPLLTLPGGAVRFSAGGGYRKNDFDLVNLNTGEKSAAGVSRSRFAYGELSLPLVAEDRSVPLVRRFSVNGALRYEDYEGFGETTTPKFGAVWGVVAGFDIKASWGRSFKAPTLNQLYQQRQLFLQSGTTYGAPAGRAVMLVFGGNPDLTPERAETLTAGFVAAPEFLPGFSLELNWFDIEFMDRVVAPISPLTQALGNPAFAEFVTLNPTVAEQNAAFAQVGLATGSFTSNSSGASYDPATVHAVIHGELDNATAQRMSGIDLLARYSVPVLGGRLTATGNASWITDATRRLTSLAPELQVAGVIYFPPEFTSRLGASWTRSGLTLSSSVSHIAGVHDADVASNPRRGSMTSLDLVVDYQLDTGIAGDIGINVAVTNALDEEPPFKQPVNGFRVNYDSTNYSALGRTVSVLVTKRF